MKNRSLPQEGLKLIACVTMLLDHISATFLPGVGLRAIGRMAFPIYCFLLAEGARHTGNRIEYGKRLLLGALLSEIPYDLLFYGQLTLEHQSVMVTLMLGYLYAVAVSRIPGDGYRILLLLPFACLAELLRSDYGGWGVVTVGIFVITGNAAGRAWIQTLWLAVLALLSSDAPLTAGIPLQLFSVAAMIPISLYDGHKLTGNIWVRRGFYLFYPVHMLVLYLISIL